MIFKLRCSASWGFFLASLVAFFPLSSFAISYAKEVFPSGYTRFGIYQDSGQFDWCLPHQIPANVVWTLRSRGNSTGQLISWYHGVVPTPSPPSTHHSTPSPSDQERKTPLEIDRKKEEDHQARVRHELDQETAIELKMKAKAASQSAKLASDTQTHAESILTKRNEDLRNLQDRAAQTKEWADKLCFPAETLIAVKEDSGVGYKFQSISTLKIGDEIVSCNLSLGAPTCEFGRIQRILLHSVDHLVGLKFSGRKLRATADHPFYVVEKQHWVQAQDLRIGDHLLSISGEYLPLEDTEIERGQFLVYNVDVQGNHNFYACGVLVHNCNSLAVIGSVAVITAEGAAEGAIFGGPPGAMVVGSAAALGYALHKATEPSDSPTDSAGSGESKRFNEEQQSLVDMAKKDKKDGGISTEDMEAYKDLNRELGDRGFPPNRVRGPEVHPNRPHGQEPHGHVGPVNHIPVSK